MERRGPGAPSLERGARAGSGRERPGDTKARKPLPPEKTYAEEFYYQKQMTTRTLVLVTLVDGEVVRGIIEWYDSACIKVHREDGPNLMIYKHHIKHIAKDPEAPGTE